MAIRTLRPEVADDEALGMMPVNARWLFAILVVKVADNEGRFRAHPAALRSSIFPYDADIEIRHVVSWLDGLATANIVVRYEHGGQVYGVIRRWWKHQASQDVRTFLPSLLPDPPANAQDPTIPARFQKAKVARAQGLTRESIGRDGSYEVEPVPNRGGTGAGPVGLEGIGKDWKGTKNQNQSGGAASPRAPSARSAAPRAQDGKSTPGGVLRYNEDDFNRMASS